MIPTLIMLRRIQLIGWLGYQMMAANYEITDEDNVVNQKYRTDMVEVTWR